MLTRFKEEFMEFKGSKTEKNLLEAFAGESQARNKYDYYASQAKKDGYVQIQKIFEETALNEKEHAKMWFKHLHGGKVPSTLENLIDAAAGEHGEWTEMYERMAREAREEGFIEIAEQFEISTRTVYRYIDALSCAGVPFITDVGKNGGISLDPNFTLENFLLSRQEKDALKDALSVNNISDNITLLINKLCV